MYGCAMLGCAQGSHLEQVVKVSTKKARYNATEDAGAGEAANVTESNWDSDPGGTGGDGDDDDKAHKDSEAVEQDVDRLIDSDSNEYVLSRSHGGYSLTLDPLLIQVRR